MKELEEIGVVPELKEKICVLVCVFILLPAMAM
jgi:hypothetical protein